MPIRTSSAAALAACLVLPCVAQQHSPHRELANADWTSLRAVYDASRHHVFAVDGGYRADHPGQQWTTLFDGRGFTTTPDAGEWTIDPIAQQAYVKASNTGASDEFGFAVAVCGDTVVVGAPGEDSISF